MDDIKRTLRDGEETTKESWRNADGESLPDAIGNAGDDLRKELGNAGDELREGLGNAGDDVRRSGQAGVDQDRETRRRSGGDESLSDKVGDAGDDIRRELGQR